MTKITNDNYYVVTGWMLNELGLKGTSLEIFAIIYGFSQDGDNVYHGSLQYLSDFTNTSKPTVIKALKDLVDKQYLVKEELNINGVKFNNYKVNLPVVKKLYMGSKETLPGGSKETLPNNKDIIINNNIYKDIVEYLNLKTGKNYKHKSKATRDLIKARMNEEFTVEDFKRVIDNMSAKWKGDKKMDEYLRPSTLFGTKFESYLNVNPGKEKQEAVQEYDPLDDLF